MKRSISTILMMTLALAMISATGFSQTTYNITSNGNWSSSLPSTCNSCTIKISTNVTLTINGSVTCQNCTFEGGAITMTNETLNLQYAGSVTTTNFDNTTVTINGNSGNITVNAPLSLTNSTFTFHNSSSITTSYEVDLSASQIYLFDDATMMANGGSTTDIDLSNSSEIEVGNGSKTSDAKMTVNGPTLNLYDNSSLNIANENNAYYNWADYVYYPNTHANAHAGKSYSTLSNSMNCGSGYPNSCSMDAAYGPSSLSSSGLVSSTTLPVVLDGFTAQLNSDKTIALAWDTRQELNSSHFTIERSADGETWEAIGTVRAQGNSTVETDYSFTDEHPLSGTNFYRLQMVDLDNSYTYSQVSVVRTSTISQISFFPNPARDYVNVSLGSSTNTTGSVTVRLVSVSGQVMQEQQVAPAPGTVVSFRVTNYASGIYILTVADANGLQESRQLLINR